MRLPTGFPPDLAPTAPPHDTYDPNDPGGAFLIETTLEQLARARRDHPDFAWPVLETDSDAERAVLFGVLRSHLPGRVHSDVPLPERGAMDARTYATLVTTLTLLVDLAGHGYASANELFGDHFAAAVALPEVFTAARMERALTQVGASSLEDVSTNSELAERYDEVYGQLPFPARHPGETLTDLLARLWRELAGKTTAQREVQNLLAEIDVAGEDRIRQALQEHWRRIRFMH